MHPTTSRMKLSWVMVIRMSQFIVSKEVTVLFVLKNRAGVKEVQTISSGHRQLFKRHRRLVERNNHINNDFRRWV